MHVTLSHKFLLECAHQLDRDSEGSRRVHGHTYHVKLTVSGPINEETGMVCDIDDLHQMMHAVKKRFDHVTLDDVMTGPATLERLVEAIFAMCDLRDKPYRLQFVAIWRADGSECTGEA